MVSKTFPLVLNKISMFSGYYLEHKVLAGMERSTITQVVESTLLEVASLESMLFFL